MITLDGENMTNVSPTGNILFSASDQTVGDHTVVLTALPASDQEVLSFNQAIVTSAVNTT